MASTLLNAVIQAAIYQINSNPQVDRTIYPYGINMLFGTGGTVIQANTGTTLQQLQAGGQAGAALVYTKIKSAATGDNVFFSSLTVAQILTALAT